jgi:DtxR family Mn-dependent transcriptional regulator
VLTDAGLRAAQELVHRHRVYEAYLGELGYPEDHLHDAADRTEHFISPDLERAVDAAVGNPVKDPHGREIPHE